MTPLTLTFTLGAGMLALAVIGPLLLRRAAPALARMPRLAITLVAGGVLAWLTSVLALGPVLAWAGTGPALLGGDLAAVCERCLAAANPFSGVATQAAIPASLLLSVPVTLALVLIVGTAVQLRRRSQRSRDTARDLLAESRQVMLHGHDVSLIDSGRMIALTLPRRHGGIVLSTATVHALRDDELAAVLAHESGHLRQRHHLIASVFESLAVYLRWVPLVRAAADALPHYLEIAADDCAQRVTGTRALVSALLKLGERHGHVRATAQDAVMLHAAGSERIRQLVQPAAGSAGTLPTAIIAAYIATLALVSVAIQLPYTSAILTGC